MRSSFLALNWRDILKGLILAFITALVTGVYQLLQTGALLNWVSFKPVLMVSIAAMLSYLIKNIFTNTQGEIFTPEPKPPVSDHS